MIAMNKIKTLILIGPENGGAYICKEFYIKDITAINYTGMRWSSLFGQV